MEKRFMQEFGGEINVLNRKVQVRMLLESCTRECQPYFETL